MGSKTLSWVKFHCAIIGVQGTVLESKAAFDQAELGVSWWQVSASA